MTLFAFLLLVLVAVSLGLGWYFRQIEAGIIESQPVWDRLIANVNRIVVDPSVSDELARDVTIYADLAGCGCFVTSFMRDLLLRDMSKKYREEKTIPEQIRLLDAGQKRLLGLVLTDMLLFDSLHMPVRGYMFRWFLKQSLEDAKDEKHRADIEVLQSVMYAAHHVAQRRLKQHRVPHQELIAQAA